MNGDEVVRRAWEKLRAGQLAEAERLFHDALQSTPEHADAYHGLATVHLHRVQPEVAVKLLEKATTLRPHFPEAYDSLGAALKDMGRVEEAERSYRKALEQDPALATTHANLGALLCARESFSAAEAHLRQALQSLPAHARLHNNLGVALRNLGRPAEAEQCYRQALALHPGYVEAHINLGAALQIMGRLEEAVECFQAALELDPQRWDAHTNLIYTLDHMDGCTSRTQQAERRRWYEQHARKFASQIRAHTNLPDPRRRIRIGYVSADFCRHAACDVFGPVILRHDKAAFEIVCYSGVKQEDEVTQQLRQAVPTWRPTVQLSDDALAEQIRRDAIDILVDLSSHSSGHRLLVFARKPAPIQVTAWGYVTGTGLKTIDYFFADPVVVPHGERALYAEEVVDLPCTTRLEARPYFPEVSGLPAISGNPFTFGCLNRIEKVSDATMKLWAQILSELPGARLQFKDRALSDDAHRQAFLRRLERSGINVGSVRLAGGTSHEDHLKTFHQVDVSLDPFPYGGHVSTLESIYMGAPVVTMLGATPQSRIAASILTAIGMQDWIATTPDDYVRIALGAARDLVHVASLRRILRRRLMDTPVGDAERYTHAVEVAYRGMWRRWCDETVVWRDKPPG